MKKNSLFYIIAVLISFMSCTHKQNNEKKAEIPDNLIRINREQFETIKLAIGEPGKMQFEEIIRCNGYLLVDPAGTARISTSVPGIVKKINCNTGQMVNTSQNLFQLSGNEFIELQRDFAEMASQLKRIRSEYERIKLLYSDKVGTEKEMILAESDFEAANAKYSALKMKLKLVGLDDSKIEEGDFYESFSLKSPLNGYISEINVSVGQYADQQTIMAEIFDFTRLQLRLAVFEKDLGKVKESQKITFNLLGDPDKYYSGTLKSVGKNVDIESKTIICYATIDDLKSNKFVNNAYVEASITTNTDTVTAVPEESIIKSGDSNYLLEFVKNENDTTYLKRVKVDIGRIKNGFIEILNQTEISKIVIKGGYNIQVE